MVDVLKEALDTEHDAYQRRTVRLSAQYSDAIQETIAALRAYDFDATGATVYVLNSGGKNKSFHLDGANMDALMEAWIDFKIDLARTKEQEDQRKAEVLAEAMKLEAEVLAEAMKLAETVPGLTVKECTDKGNNDAPYWEVKHDWLPFDWRYTYGPDGLTEKIKEVKEKYDAEQIMLAEARKIAEQIGGVTIKSVGNGRCTLTIEGEFAHCSFEYPGSIFSVLERLQTVQRDIDRKAERETHKAQPVAAEQGQHGDYSDLF